MAAIAVHALLLWGLLHAPPPRPSSRLAAALRAASRGAALPAGAGERLRFVAVTPAGPQRPAPLRVAPPVRRTPPRPPPPPPPPVPQRAEGTAVAGVTPDTAQTSGADGGGGAGGGTSSGRGMGADTGSKARADKVHARIASNILIGVDAPAKVRPFQLKVLFEVDPQGHARVLSATRTRDDGYNRTLMGELAEIRFHPALLPNGAAVADTVPLEWDF